MFLLFTWYIKENVAETQYTKRDHNKKRKELNNSNQLICCRYTFKTISISLKGFLGNFGYDCVTITKDAKLVSKYTHLWPIDEAY